MTGRCLSAATCNQWSTTAGPLKVGSRVRLRGMGRLVGVVEVSKRAHCGFCGRASPVAKMPDGGLYDGRMTLAGGPETEART